MKPPRSVPPKPTYDGFSRYVLTESFSLRSRLTLIILIPLLAISVLVGFWAFKNANQTASDIFNRSLLAAALAVSNDVTLSGGDALSDRTREILADTSGGLVFYHVYAPDGVIVAGYATPPVGIPQITEQDSGPSYFTARYQGQDVNGVRLQLRTEIDGFSGTFTITVWQKASVREAFISDLQNQSLIIISALILSIACVVWFGVRLGLSPLLDLRKAIDRRSSDELSPIRRHVPVELKGIVATLNRLFRHMSESMTAQSDFISNAAHQLRNPIAGVLSLAEAVNTAHGEQETKKRAAELLVSARSAADLSNKLLAIERMKAAASQQLFTPLDLSSALINWFPDLEKTAGATIAITQTHLETVPPINCDATMLHEALVNLVDNARKHGGPTLDEIKIECRLHIKSHQKVVEISVADNGIGIKEAEIPTAIERFSQLPSGSNQGSGLGLTLVQTVAHAHGGDIQLKAENPGLKVSLYLPLQEPSAIGI